MWLRGGWITVFVGWCWCCMMHGVHATAMTTTPLWGTTTPAAPADSATPAAPAAPLPRILPCRHAHDTTVCKHYWTAPDPHSIANRGNMVLRRLLPSVFRAIERSLDNGQRHAQNFFDTTMVGDWGNVFNKTEWGWRWQPRGDWAYALPRIARYLGHLGYSVSSLSCNVTGVAGCETPWTNLWNERWSLLNGSTSTATHLVWKIVEFPRWHGVAGLGSKPLFDPVTGLVRRYRQYCFDHLSVREWSACWNHSPFVVHPLIERDPYVLDISRTTTTSLVGNLDALFTISNVRWSWRHFDADDARRIVLPRIDWEPITCSFNVSW